ncbi:MAG TPA: hypothetical protein DIT07_05245 [Sphingobacteriaceae bacterium]|nr:hypothetical protein [Sphingobacteriaceae bacterium]
MIEFTSIILKFADQDEKTGWTYIEIPADIAQQLKPGNKKTFRAKGMLDQLAFFGAALMPMGEGNFIMALNADMRKGLRKQEGAILHVQIEADNEFSIQTPDYMLECFEYEPEALNFYNSLTKSHRDYFVKWIEGAKTEPTKIKRLTQTISALSKGYSYGEMIRMFRKG